MTPFVYPIVHRPLSRALVRSLALSVMWIVAACGSSPPPAPTTASVSNRTTSVLGVGDAFDVRVYGEENLTGTYQVSEDGTIDFPFIGRVKVGGLEPGAAGELIEMKLKDGGYLLSPQVTVLVKEYQSKRVSVLGAVNKPGTFPIASGLSVVQAISLAGGFTALASRDNTVVSRRVDGEVKKFRVRVDDVTSGNAADVPLEAGDIVYVPERVF